ncbi:hypothetical protein EUX98_g8871 [Antrodiella citrinella]|uniref:Uncharacterized protein n=1 Tax=Antrodiella citrinella TaxID=2447956 RepID=A0A4S4M3I9_9APHY|nr:hypothetical protein EUX98_g8871 [Antrodiella citrinella]
MDTTVMQRIIDVMANNFGYGDSMNEFREGMHYFAQLGAGLTSPDLLTRLQLLGNVNSLATELRKMSKTLADVCIKVDKIHAHMEEHFALSQEQHMNIRILSADHIFDYKRVSFMELQHEVFTHIRQHYKQLFANVFGNPMREKILLARIQKICSSLRNRFREMLILSVSEVNHVPLDDFLVTMVTTFKRGGHINDNVRKSTTEKLAILRRWVLSNMSDAVATVPEDVDDDETSDSEELTSVPATETGGTRAAKKRKVSTGKTAPRVSGRPKKGHCFWSKIERWFIAQRAKTGYGDNLTSEAWVKYIDTTVKKDRQQFKAVEVLPPPSMNADDELEYQDVPSTAGGTALTTGQTRNGMQDILALVQAQRDQTRR